MNDNAVVALIIGIFLALIAMGWASYWFLARHVTVGVMNDRAIAQNQNRSRDPERGHGSVHIPRYSYNGWTRPPRKEKSLYLAKPGYIMVRTANGERLHRVGQPLWVDNNFSPKKGSQPQKGNQNQNQPQRQSQNQNQNQNQGQKKQNRKKNKQNKENNRNKQSNYKEQNSQNQTDWGNANNNQNNQDHQEQIEWENANNNNQDQDQGYQAQTNWDNANNQNNQDHQEQVEWENANNQDNQGDQQDQNQNDWFTGNNDRNDNGNQPADWHSIHHGSRGIPQSGLKDGHGGHNWNSPMEEQLGYNNNRGKEENKESPW
jgi:hypothetical protein